MNYRHAYHAGNFADLFKHAALVLLIQSLQKKEKGFVCLDTHAGIGLYDLAGTEAGKTGEWQSGIGRLMRENAADADGEDPDAAGPLAPFLHLVRGLNPDGGLRWYPGSPALARALARPQDRLELFELHPEDAASLAARHDGDRQVSVRAVNGYTASLKRIPPAERRGLVLVDPPFERPDEFPTLTEYLALAHRRWATGCFVLWYPVKSRGDVSRFHQALAGLGIAKTLAAQFTLGDGPDLDGQFHGSGLILVNPPWQFEETLLTLGQSLARRLALPAARTRVGWLVDETGAVGPGL
jgi:23S rRNA (adenine2030-N6)-methyltransferase